MQRDRPRVSVSRTKAIYSNLIISIYALCVAHTAIFFCEGSKQGGNKNRIVFSI